MQIATDWKDYELIDTGNGERLERWGETILRRPDPQILWPLPQETEQWNNVDGHYHRSSSGGGQWQMLKPLPDRWEISYKALRFYIKAMGFKHTGLFPEQAVNWDWMIDKIQNARRPIRVLNLFAYTGGATVACAYAGAEVCHIDASKGMVTLAKENIRLSGLENRAVRFIADDVEKFVKREKTRGRTYDGIIMDPPSYGRGPGGEVWKIEEKLYGLIQDCVDILSPNPLFFIINSYTTGFSPTVLSNVLNLTVGKKFQGKLTAEEIGLPISQSNMILPCGILGRWEK